MTPRQALYAKVEAKHGFTLPAAYVALGDAGRLDPGTVRRNAGRADLIDQPYLWLNEMEWLPLPAVLEKPYPWAKPAFVPFARDGGGGCWCWYPPAARRGRVPIVRCPRDDQTADVYAPDFARALYRQALDFALESYGEDGTLDRRYLARWSNELGPLLPRRCAATLARLADPSSAPLPLTRSAYDRLVSRDLAFARLGEHVTWMDE